MFDILIKGGVTVDGSGATPLSADIAVKDGLIAEIGTIRAPARQTIDADGAIVTPGWIDAHTHYDGQVTWDDSLEGSAANGVTTAIMGNCGVGFAPVQPQKHLELIDLMEGVEDIPGSALFEGMPWGAWHDFPSYLEFLDSRSWSLDIAAQIGHGPLRYYVMGERALGDGDATADEIERMAEMVQEAMRAGAIGFSTSRVPEHKSRSGFAVPGTYAPETELETLAMGLRAGGGGVFQAIGAGTIGEMPDTPAPQSALLNDVELFARLSRRSGQRVVFTTLQRQVRPTEWQDILAKVEAENQSGALLSPMVATRPVTFLASLRTYHPFMLKPTYKKLAHLSHDARLKEMKKAEVKSSILAESSVREEGVDRATVSMVNLFNTAAPIMFQIKNGFDYEPSTDKTIRSLSLARGQEPLECFYDLLLEDNGESCLILLGANYADGNLDACREMLLHPATVTGLSDAGAHVRMICDMSMPTFNLTHWVRDRTRGARLPLELVVAKITGALADVYGLHDRGRLAVGKRADINVIDFENLSDHPPVLRNDLPANGSRFLQLSTGYLATLVQGEITRQFDRDTGARPGRLARRVAA